ncbi:MAG: PepSY domain-containing protein [Roseibium sp.]|uniref:PepSY domain-containing protein n=1 Tax=Roseibium sp. TaxID=1936156 RepID=UPI001AFD2028|nr:PepSY domain-containing protein [Roseibium sp.]MBO6508890.1 PepSY domain-containing protein [Roseibium sp.]MBO6894800.1 PepSY domain-containing protein [Roseibium sp.]MBO6929393.1 PepSY domain-containing protein [Roseibium sp.]
MTSFNRLVRLGAIAPIAFLTLGAAASAEYQPGDKIGLSISDIARGLENNGYEIREIEVKDDRIEAEVTLEGDKLEIKIDPMTGLVTRVEDD